MSGSCATLNGKPVGDASASVRVVSVPSCNEVRMRVRSSGEKPESTLIAKRVPTWMPAAPISRASRSRSGEPHEPASQKGSPDVVNLAGSISSRGP